jgi:hypothetical protein
LTIVNFCGKIIPQRLIEKAAHRANGEVDMRISKKLIGTLGLALAVPMLSIPASADTCATATCSDAVIVLGQQFDLTEGQQQLLQTNVFTGGTNGNAVNFYQDAGLTIYSDQVSIRGGLVYFTSDPYPAFTDVTVVFSLKESGVFQDVSQYFNLAPGAIQVRSDVETPLPSTWTMMLIGLAAFGFVATRRVRSPAARPAVA